MPDLIELRASTRSARRLTSLEARSLPVIARIKTLLRTLVVGEIPPGFTVTTRSRSVPLWVEAKLTWAATYEGGDLIIERYELQNRSGAEMRLEEREFATLGEDVLAIALRHHVLAPGGTTSVWLVRRHSV
jgi:hypothetical protein